MMDYAEFTKDIDARVLQRWNMYSKAMQEFPRVREEEILRTAELTNPQRGEIVVEIGTGSGGLTWLLAKALEEQGAGFVRTLDCNYENILRVLSWDLPVESAHHASHSDKPLIDIPIASKVATLATFHHYDTRKPDTGTSGRAKLLQQTHDALLPGGTLTLVDVANDTRTQRYFDAIDNPRHCYPLGHPHSFVDRPLIERLCNEAGLTDVTYEIAQTPWRFTNEAEAKTFLHTLHNARCTPQESLALAQQHLGWEQTAAGYELGWELAFVQAKKPD